MAFPFMIECDRRRPRHVTNHFGLGLTPNDFQAILSAPQEHCYLPWRNLHALQDTGSSIKEDKNKFQVNLDVQHFAPEEISVKTADGFLVVEAKHEEREDDHGFISRSFTGRYAMPEGVLEDSVTSRLSSDGVLSITAPLKAPEVASNVRIVPIIQTGPFKNNSEQN